MVTKTNTDVYKPGRSKNKAMRSGGSYPCIPPFFLRDRAETAPMAQPNEGSTRTSIEDTRD